MRTYRAKRVTTQLDDETKRAKKGRREVLSIPLLLGKSLVMWPRCNNKNVLQHDAGEVGCAILVGMHRTRYPAHSNPHTGCFQDSDKPHTPADGRRVHLNTAVHQDSPPSRGATQLISPVVETQHVLRRTEGGGTVKLTETALLAPFRAAPSAKTFCSSSLDSGSSGYKSGRSEGMGGGFGLGTLREVLTWTDVARPVFVRTRLVVFVLMEASVGIPRIVPDFRGTTTLGIGEEKVETMQRQGELKQGGRYQSALSAHRNCWFSAYFWSLNIEWPPHFRSGFTHLLKFRSLHNYCVGRPEYWFIVTIIV